MFLESPGFYGLGDCPQGRKNLETLETQSKLALFTFSSSCQFLDWNENLIKIRSLGLFKIQIKLTQMWKAQLRFCDRAERRMVAHKHWATETSFVKTIQVGLTELESANTDEH